MPELILSCGHKEYVCTTISVEMYRRYTEIMERNDSDSISDAFEANTKILMTVFGARQREVEEADPEDVLSAVKEIHFMMQDVITKKFLDLNVMGAEDHVCGNKRRSDCTVQKSAAPSER